MAAGLNFRKASNSLIPRRGLHRRSSSAGGRNAGGERAPGRLAQHRFYKFPAGWFLRGNATPANLTSGRFLRGILPHIHERIDNTAECVEHRPLEAAFAASLAIGLDGAGEALRILVHEASKIERAPFLNAQPYERSSGRTEFANSHKPKTVMTHVGELIFDVPRVVGHV